MTDGMMLALLPVMLVLVFAGSLAALVLAALIGCLVGELLWRHDHPPK